MVSAFSVVRNVDGDADADVGPPLMFADDDRSNSSNG